MELLLQRDESCEWTHGRLYIDGNYECDTLEDQKRYKKIPGDTRIPAGRYEIKLRTFGGHHEAYKKKKVKINGEEIDFSKFHVGMLWLQGVEKFTDILMHIGNFIKDTKGCILVGLGFNEELGMLTDSTIAYIRMYLKVSKALLSGERVFITIKDVGQCD